jgi:hypothetical protein
MYCFFTSFSTFTDSCEFQMPKCPFTDVSHKATTTTSTTPAPTTKTTLSQNTDTEAAAVRNPKPTSWDETETKETQTKETEEKKIRKQILNRPTDLPVTDPPTEPKNSKLSTNEGKFEGLVTWSETTHIFYY